MSTSPLATSKVRVLQVGILGTAWARGRDPEEAHRPPSGRGSEALNRSRGSARWWQPTGTGNSHAAAGGRRQPGAGNRFTVRWRVVIYWKPITDKLALYIVYPSEVGALKVAALEHRVT